MEHGQVRRGLTTMLNFAINNEAIQGGVPIPLLTNNFIYKGYDVMAKHRITQHILKRQVAFAIGKRYGYLTVVGEPFYVKSNNAYRVKMQCDCGEYKEVQTRFLKSGYVTHCGCKKKKRICQVNGCEGKHHVGGYCRRHHDQITTHGKIFGNPKKLPKGAPNRHRFEDGVCKIEICNHDGYSKDDAIVDLEDYEKIKDMRWWSDCKGYVKTSFKGCRNNVQLHRFLLDLSPGDGKMVDHKNRNPLDNRRSNLRFCTRSENFHNSEKSKNNTSGYKGICWDNRLNKWVVKFTSKRKRIHVGCFDSIECAVLEYNKAIQKYNGEFAVLTTT